MRFVIVTVVAILYSASAPAAEGDDALLEPHVKAFDITGRPMKGWVLVGPEGLEDNDQLKDWIQRAVKFVGKLPKK